MATVDQVIVELEAKVARYNADVRLATANFEKAIGRQEAQVKRLENQVRASSGAIGSQLRGLVGTFVAAFSVQRIQEFADGYTRFTNQLKVAGLEGQRLASTQDKLFGIAQRYGIELESLGTLYSRGTQSAKELGASQADLIQFTTGVAAALKIQGTSATEARGALLQLSQLLASGTVRAEEFNSVNEGALPILRAVANNINAAGGSVGKLKFLVNDGKVSSQEFFRAFIAGSADLEKQAESTTLTIGNAFTVLNNALGKYIGEADESLSATERLSAAIIALSENLDTVATAVGVIGTVLLGRFVGGAVAGSAALRTIAAYAAIATTSLAGTALAARAAGAALLTALGGPVGVAVIALAAGLYYLATRTGDAAQATGIYAEQSRQLKGIQEKVADATDRLATATGKARAEALANARAVREETIQYLANARAAALAARAKARETLETYRQEKAAADAAPAVGVGSGGTPGMGLNPSVSVAFRNAEQARINFETAEKNVIFAENKIAVIEEALKAPPPLGPVGGGGKDKKSKGRGPTGPSADEVADRQADEAARLQQEELRARLELTTNIEERGDLERQLLGLERDQRLRDLARQEREIKENDNLSADEKKERLAAVDAQRGVVERLYGRQRAEAEGGDITVEGNNSLYEQLRMREEMRQLLERQLQNVLADLSHQDSMLMLQGDLAGTLDARRDIELRRVDIAHRIEREQLLEEISQAELAKDTERLAAARKRLADLEERIPLEREAARRRNADPLERYRRGLEDPKTRVQEAVVQKLDAVTDGIADGIAEFIGTDDPFIKSLIKILIEDVLIKPMLKALEEARAAGGGDLGGILSSALSLFGGGGGASAKLASAAAKFKSIPGFATGTSYAPGGMAIVGEHGPELVNLPRGSQVIPNHLLGAAAAGNGIGGTIRLELSDDIDARIIRTSGKVAFQVVRASEPGLTSKAVAETRRQFGRPRP